MFVCEFVTGGGFAGETLPPGLRHEGDLMLSALVKDLADVAGVEVTFARDSRLAAVSLPARCVTFRPDADPWTLWAQCIDEADAVWPIAPETGGALARLSDMVVAHDRILLGSNPEAIRLTTSKRATATHLKQHGIPVAMAEPADTVAAAPDAPGGWVFKPDDGAGSEDTFLLTTLAELPERLAGKDGAFVVQPYLPGAAASLSLLCHNGKALLLACNRQDMAIKDGMFRFLGVTVGGMEARRDAFEPLATAIAAAIPSLSGYVGVDLVDGPDGPVVLEINPRLTTSYAGLRAAIGQNPAALVLDHGIGFRPGAVRPVTIDVMETHA